jgi:hypothetical protein
MEWKTPALAVRGGSGQVFSELSAVGLQNWRREEAHRAGLAIAGALSNCTVVKWA